LYIKARIGSQLFLQHGIQLLGQLFFNDGRQVARIVGSGFQFPAKYLDVQSRQIAESYGVEIFFELAWNDHQVVGGLVEQQGFAVAIVHDAAGGVFGDVTESIVFCRFLIGVVDDLYVEQADNKYEAKHQEDAGDDNTP